MSQVKVKCTICGCEGHVDEKVISGDIPSATWQVVWVSDSRGRRNETSHHDCLMGTRKDNGSKGVNSDRDDS